MSKPLTNLGAIGAARSASDDTVLIAVGLDGDEQDYSGRELESRVQAVAAMLQRRGLEPGARIGILAANSIGYLAAWLGTMRAGLISVPINQKQSRNTIEYICRDAGVELAFADADGAERLPEDIEVIPVGHLPTEAEGFQETDTDPESTALILYTSGSTGKPKGVILSHRSQLAMILNVTSGADRALFEGRTGIVAAPMFHMNALVFLASFMLGGGRIVLMAKFDAARHARLIEKHRVDVVTGVPTMVTLLHDAIRELGEVDLSTVKTVYIGSAPVTEAVVRQARELMPNASVINSYGTTETGGGLFGPHPDGRPRPPTSVGYPQPNVGLRLEGYNGAGVLHVKADSAMSGYLNLPELTAERMKDGWYETGDLFRVDQDGFFYFVGRADDMFVCSGENIYPGEVEKTIELHPDVTQACVVPVPDRVRGQMPVAWVVAHGNTVDERAIQEHVRANAAPYLYPRRVWFLDSLPLAGTGKIDRRALMERAADSIREQAEEALH